MVPKLIARVISGVFMISSVLYSARFFPLTTISVVSNLCPVLTLIFGVILLNESAQKLDVMCVILSFTGVTLMTVGVI